MLTIYASAALVGSLILSGNQEGRKNFSWLFATPLIGISALFLPVVMAIPLSIFGFNFHLSFAITSFLFLITLIIYTMRTVNLLLIYQILTRTLLVFGISVIAHQLLTRMFRAIFTYDSFEMLEASRDIVYGNIDLANTALSNWSLSYIALQIIGVILNLEYINGAFGVILVLTLISIAFSLGPSFRKFKNRNEKLCIYLFFASLITLVFSQIFQTMVYYQNGHSIVLAVFSFMLMNAVKEINLQRFEVPLYQLILLASLPLLRVEGFVYWLSFFFYYVCQIKFEKRNLLKIILTLTPASVYYSVLFFFTRYSEVSKFLFLLVPLLNLFLIIVLYFRNYSLFFDAILLRVQYLHITLIAYFLILVFSFDASITSIFAVITNLSFSGLWGLFWLPTSILFFKLMQSVDKVPAFLVQNFFLAPLLAILCTGGARGIPFRLTWADSGNRMIFHLCLAIPIIALLHLKSQERSHA